MTHISDLKIWVRLTAAISIMLAIAGSAMIFWESYVNRQTAISQAREFSLSMHEATMAGLTGMMLTGTVGQREVFLDQIKQLSVIRDLRVIRGENVSKVFGPGNAKDAGASDDIRDPVDYAGVVERLRADMAASHFNLLEKLAEHIATWLLENFAASWVRVSVAKLGMMPGVKRVGVIIERSI